MVKNCLKNRNKKKYKYMPKKSVSWSNKIKDEKLIPSRTSCFEEESNEDECCCNNLLSFYFCSNQKEKTNDQEKSTTSFLNNQPQNENLNKEIKNNILSRKSESYDSLPNLLNVRENIYQERHMYHLHNHCENYCQIPINNDINYINFEI